MKRPMTETEEGIILAAYAISTAGGGDQLQKAIHSLCVAVSKNAEEVRKEYAEDFKVKFVHPDLPDNKPITISGYKLPAFEEKFTDSWWIGVFRASGLKLAVTVNGNRWEFPKDLK
jgi:hypothetical protein